ncbi:MAG: DegT/DnrJ/EryC1/StrS family aminotransferase [Clostridia bacterium]|nr:DegT/DnrJ/EryC1/StrS family aminotransferase [Clostridia bacterium]
MINVIRSSIPPFDEYCDEIKSIWNNHWLTNDGDKHKELESKLCEFLGVENLTLFVNGHMALEMAIDAMGLTGEVITTPFTFASTTHAIVRNGLNPVFCDINDVDYTINADKIERLITEKTSAILPVHVYGNICDYKKIESIAKKYNLKVIYDAAHAFAEEVDGMKVGNLGDASMFSFHATKVFNTIEGGCVCYKDANLKTKLNNLKNFGILDAETVEAVGANAKMNEFAAAMGLCNLRHIDEEIAKRKEVYERYLERLEGVSGLELCNRKCNVKYNYAYFPVVFDSYKYNRDEVDEKLRKNGILARKYFYPLTNSYDCYDFDVSQTPKAFDISNKVLTLPMYADLDLADVDRICDVILD